jgi:hypothetical protein
MTDEFDEARQLSSDPFQIARMFFTALQWHPDSADEFQYLLTPEALTSDAVDLAAALMRSVENPGLSTQTVYAPDHPTVAYVAVHRGITASGYISPDTPLDDPLYITLAWRPECGGWMVHAFGDIVQPDDVPHGS